MNKKFRTKIKEITFTPTIRGLRRAYFSVHFLNKEGVIKKRLIMLPGSLNNGKKETELALTIMKDEGLINLVL